MCACALWIAKWQGACRHAEHDVDTRCCCYCLAVIYTQLVVRFFFFLHQSHYWYCWMTEMLYCKNKNVLWVRIQSHLQKRRSQISNIRQTTLPAPSFQTFRREFLISVSGCGRISSYKCQRNGVKKNVLLTIVSPARKKTHLLMIDTNTDFRLLMS